MTLWESISAAGALCSGVLHGESVALRLAELEVQSHLDGDVPALRGRSIVIVTQDQLLATLALVELDGIAGRLVLCPPDVSPQHLAHIIEVSEADAWIGGGESCEQASAHGVPVSVPVRPTPIGRRVGSGTFSETEWILVTSGTTGMPKLVVHTFESLAYAVAAQPVPLKGKRAIWSTFYDIRRYGGLQVFLRGLHAGAFVFSSPTETTTEFLARAGKCGVTHISGTPSHWRKVLMSGAAGLISPEYVRLSGEIADQGILNGLRAAFPQAIVAHAFASTEAGVGFEVRDGQAGFPQTLVEDGPEGVQIDLSHGTLRLRSKGNARSYLGRDAPPLRSVDGFVDTTDRLELRAGRYFFVGRSGGVINVGGMKVHPEEVESVINAHPWVRMSLVKPRHSPITGAVVCADVVLREPANAPRPPEDVLRAELLEACRAALPAHKVPVALRIVPTLEIAPSGKLVRRNA